MRHLAAITMLTLGVGPPLLAQSSPNPQTVEALAQLDAGNCDSAFRVFTASWTGSGDDTKRQQLMASCGFLKQLGPLAGHDLLRTVDITPHLQRVYAVLLYDRQPVYMMIVAYRAATGWKVQTVNWHTDFDTVIPPQLYGPEHPATAGRGSGG